LLISLKREAEIWLSQFSHNFDDYMTAKKLISFCHLIRQDDFILSMNQLIDINFSNEIKTAFFVEKELRKNKSIPQKMYKVNLIPKPGRRRHIRRAYGAALHPIQSPRLDSHVIGSEALIAHLLSKQCSLKENQDKYFLHPSADEFRRKKIRRIVIVTDLIGSGQRIIDMLESLWKVETIKSWRSYKKISFHILCYSATEAGEQRIKHHKTHPSIIKLMDCPTIYNSFSSSEISSIITLCNSYGSFAKEPLGYNNSGVLISFSHSIPNNSPAILSKSHSGKGKTWGKFFPDPYNMEGSYDSILLSFSKFEDHAYKILGMNYMKDFTDDYKFNQKAAMLFLCLIGKGLNHDNEILHIPHCLPYHILNMENQASREKLVNIMGRSMTSKGRSLFNKLLEQNDKMKKAVESQSGFYYPTQLRAPKS